MLLQPLAGCFVDGHAGRYTKGGVKADMPSTHPATFLAYIFMGSLAGGFVAGLVWLAMVPLIWVFLAFGVGTAWTACYLVMEDKVFNLLMQVQRLQKELAKFPCKQRKPICTPAVSEVGIRPPLTPWSDREYPCQESESQQSWSDSLSGFSSSCVPPGY